jgi:hypothetical protein
MVNDVAHSSILKPIVTSSLVPGMNSEGKTSGIKHSSKQIISTNESVLNPSGIGQNSEFHYANRNSSSSGNAKTDNSVNSYKKRKPVSANINTFNINTSNFTPGGPDQTQNSYPDLISFDSPLESPIGGSANEIINPTPTSSSTNDSNSNLKPSSSSVDHTLTVNPLISPENHSNNNDDNNNSNDENNVSATVLKYANRLKNILGSDVEIDNGKLKKVLERLNLDAGDEITSKILKKVTKEFVPEYRLKTETKSNSEGLDGLVKEYKTVNIPFENPTPATPGVQFRKEGDTYKVFYLSDMTEIMSPPDHLKSPDAYLQYLKKNAGAEDVELLYGKKKVLHELKKQQSAVDAHKSAETKAIEEGTKGATEKKLGDGANINGKPDEAVKHFAVAADHYRKQVNFLKQKLSLTPTYTKFFVRNDLASACTNWRDCAYEAGKYHDAIDACYAAKDVLAKFDGQSLPTQERFRDYHMLRNATCEAACLVQRNPDSKARFRKAEECLEEALNRFNRWKKDGELVKEVQEKKYMFEEYIKALTYLRNCKASLQSESGAGVNTSAVTNPKVAELDAELIKLKAQYDTMHGPDANP